MMAWVLVVIDSVVLFLTACLCSSCIVGSYAPVNCGWCGGTLLQSVVSPCLFAWFFSGRLLSRSVSLYIVVVVGYVCVATVRSSVPTCFLFHVYRALCRARWWSAFLFVFYGFGLFGFLCFYQVIRANGPCPVWILNSFCMSMLFLSIPILCPDLFQVRLAWLWWSLSSISLSEKLRFVQDRLYCLFCSFMAFQGSWLRQIISFLGLLWVVVWLQQLHFSRSGDTIFYFQEKSSRLVGLVSTFFLAVRLYCSTLAWYVVVYCQFLIL